MKKVLLQLTVTAALFIGVWQALSLMGWMEIFKVEEKQDKLEKKLGDFLWKNVENDYDISDDDFANETLDSLVRHICKANDIDHKKLKLHIANVEMINAFAMPDDHIVVFSGLIKDCESQEELCGVLSHELAHLEKNHIMRKLIKEIGMAALVGLTGDNSGAVKEVLRTLSSQAYARELETEADETAIEYLIAADIDPKPMADFMYRMSFMEDEMSEAFEFLSTHPGSEDRSKNILEIIEDSEYKTKKVIQPETFDKFKEVLGEVDGE